MTDPDEWTSRWYDGELALRPFLRAWWRDRMAALRCFIRYRVLRRKRPELPRGGGAASLTGFSALLKQVYSADRVADLAGMPNLSQLKISKPSGLTSPIAVRMQAEAAAARFAPGTKVRTGAGMTTIGVVEGACPDHDYPAVKVLWGSDRVASCVRPEYLEPLELR
jgi:hypothetical protein